MNSYDTVELVTGNYNPRDCNIGILHVGPGNFHRAHQAVYVHRLMSETNDLKWGIAGVNLRPESKSFSMILKNVMVVIFLKQFLQRVILFMKK